MMTGAVGEVGRSFGDQVQAGEQPDERRLHPAGVLRRRLGLRFELELRVDLGVAAQLLLERHDRRAGELRSEPGAEVHVAQLFEGEVTDATRGRATRRPVDGGVVHAHQHVVLRELEVALEHVGARGDRAVVGGEGVLRRVGARAAMRNHQRRRVVGAGIRGAGLGDAEARSPERESDRHEHGGTRAPGASAAGAGISRGPTQHRRSVGRKVEREW